jgi:hypothetical protein
MESRVAGRMGCRTDRPPHPPSRHSGAIVGKWRDGTRKTGGGGGMSWEIGGLVLGFALLALPIWLMWMD